VATAKATWDVDFVGIKNLNRRQRVNSFDLGAGHRILSKTGVGAEL
jgi:hypothetical protein